MADTNAPAVDLAGGGGINVAHQVKLPSFWSKDPEIWFLQAESVFAGLNITVSRSKFNHVLPLLPCWVLATIRDVIVATERGDVVHPYADLRGRLFGAFTPSKWQLANMILNFPDIGDRHPSQLMADLLALLELLAPDPSR